MMNHNNSLLCEHPVWGEFTMNWLVLRGLMVKPWIRGFCELALVVQDRDAAGGNR